jgi:hypothetical protein
VVMGFAAGSGHRPDRLALPILRIGFLESLVSSSGYGYRLGFARPVGIKREASQADTARNRSG